MAKQGERKDRRVAKGARQPETANLTHDEVLALLAGAAKNGSISAMIALERALRAADREASAVSVDDELQALIRHK